MKKMVVTVILGLTLAIGSANAVIFEDNFDSYTGGSITTLELASAGVWVTPGWGDGAAGSDIKVGGSLPPVAYFSNNVNNDGIRFGTVTTETGLSDYTVNLEAWEKPGAGYLRLYAAGRVSGSSYIAAGASVSGDQVFLDLKESTGTEPGANWYVADWDSSEPIHVELALSGNSVTATVTHVGYSVTQSYTTTVLDPGAFGMGGWKPWGYAVGRFDNFSVVPEPATMSLLALGIGLAGLKRRKA